MEGVRGSITHPHYPPEVTEELVTLVGHRTSTLVRAAAARAPKNGNMAHSDHATASPSGPGPDARLILTRWCLKRQHATHTHDQRDAIRICRAFMDCRANNRTHRMGSSPKPQPVSGERQTQTKGHFPLIFRVELEDLAGSHLGGEEVEERALSDVREADDTHLQVVPDTTEPGSRRRSALVSGLCNTGSDRVRMRGPCPSSNPQHVFMIRLDAERMVIMHKRSSLCSRNTVRTAPHHTDPTYSSWEACLAPGDANPIDLLKKSKKAQQSQ